jgi:hypothetical protein
MEFDASIEPLVETIVDLSKYAWMFRYPGDPVEPSIEEAREALSRATAVVAEMRTRVFGANSPATDPAG